MTLRFFSVLHTQTHTGAHMLSHAHINQRLSIPFLFIYLSATLGVALLHNDAVFTKGECPVSNHSIRLGICLSHFSPWYDKKKKKKLNKSSLRDKVFVLTSSSRVWSSCQGGRNSRSAREMVILYLQWRTETGGCLSSAGFLLLCSSGP